MEVNPFSILECTLEEDSCSAIQSPDLNEEESDPLNFTCDPNALSNPTLSIFSHSLTPSEKVWHNSIKLASVTEEELQYRSQAFTNIELFLQNRLHCTICDAHIECRPSITLNAVTHPLLKVICCNSCTLKYSYVGFPLSPSGHDIKCRWCANSEVHTNPLRYCSKCPFAFCEQCISRNFPVSTHCRELWICFVCCIEQLYPARAVLAAFLQYFAEKTEELNSWVDDISQCCTTHSKKHNQNSREENTSHIEAPSSQYSMIPDNKLIVETKWVKQQFRLICNALIKEKDKINDISSNLKDFDEADRVQMFVESIATHAKSRIDDIAKSCANLRSEFSMKLKRGRTAPQQKEPSKNNLSVSKNQVAGLTTSSKKQCCDKDVKSSKINTNLANCRGINSLFKINNLRALNSKTSNNCNMEQKTKIKLNPKGQSTAKIQKTSSRKRKTKNEKCFTIDMENGITEFNGIPIKKCFVQLERISIPPSVT